MAREPQTRHSKLQAFQLMGLVQTEYAGAGKTDGAFAEMATEKLGFLVKESHVQWARKELGIRSYRAVLHEQLEAKRASKPAKSAGQALLHNRVTDLEYLLDVQSKEIKKLADRLEVYVKGSRA